MKTVLLSALAMAGHAAAFHSKATPVNGDLVEGEYVVTLKSSASLDKALASVLTKQALDKVEHIFGNYEGASFKGFSLKECDVETASQVADLEDVAAIEQAQMYYTNAVQENPVWGLDRIDQRPSALDNLYYYKDSAGAGVDVYCIDTGVRYTHTDFGGRASFGFTAFNDDGGDRNGHGTHVASTMAGTTYGVAKEANIFGVKVLGDNGSGSTNGVVAGVDWVNGRSSSRTKIGNMSLGGGASAAMDNAVNAAGENTLHVVASGNSNANACNFSPARASNAFTVNAMQQGDSRSSFSNFGTCTEIFAPGSNVQAAWSTSDTATNTISGTSMASPHVAGVAALLVGDSHSLTASQLKSTMEGLATPNAISNAGAGSPNLLSYNDGDGPSTPAPPTLPPPPTTPAPTPEGNPCGCSDNCVNLCQQFFGMFCCNESGGTCYCNPQSVCCDVDDEGCQFINKMMASN